MYEKLERKKGLLFIITALAALLLIPSVFAAGSQFFVTADLGSNYTYQGTTVRYVNAVDVSNLAVSQMKIADGDKTITSPMIGNVERIFSSTHGTAKGVTINITSAQSTVDYNAALNEYILTDLGNIPSLYSKIPSSTTDGEKGVFLMLRANTSVTKGSISTKSDLILAQEAAYLFVGESSDKAIIYKSVYPAPAQQGAISMGATPFYNKSNFGQTITYPTNVVDLNGYTSLGAGQSSVVAGKYGAVAMSYDNVDTFSIWGATPVIILDSDPTITWNGTTPSTYVKGSGDVELSFSSSGMTNMSYVIVNSSATYDARVYVNTTAFADKVNTEWDAMVSTAPLMSNVLENIILAGVGSGVEDPYTYAIKTSTESTFPANASTWSQIAITDGYGISGYSNADSVIIANDALDTLIPGTYTIYAFAIDGSLDPVAFDSQTITIISSLAPVADFTASETYGYAPMEVKFTDTSTGSPTSWVWDFGDGTDSTEQSPTHTYSNSGQYTANLTVTNDYGSSSKTTLITAAIKGGGGTSGGAGVSRVTPTPAVTKYITTGTLSTNTSGVVAGSIEVFAIDEKAALLISSGTTALAADGTPLSEVTIVEIDPESAPSISGAMFAFKNLYFSCTPENATFSPPINIVFQLTEQEFNSLEPGQSFSIQYYNMTTSQWVEIPTTSNSNTFQVIGEVSHFSIYVLMIVGEGGMVTETPTVTATATAITGSETPTPIPSTGEEGIWIGILIIIIIIVIIGAGWWYYNNKK